MKTSFSELAEKLKAANDRRDWSGLEELDVRVRADIELAVSRIETERDRQLVISFLKRYDKIYSLILKDSVKHRDEISKELQKVTKENRVANTYLDSSGY